MNILWPLLIWVQVIGSEQPLVLASSKGTYQVTVTPSKIPLNESFALEVRVCLAQGGVLPQKTTLRVDARMPHHRHGMVQVPILKALGEGRFRVEGMLCHMPGRWEVYFDVSHEGRTERAQWVVELE